MANTNMNKSWDLAQGAVTLSPSGGGSVTMQNVLVETPIISISGDDLLLTKGYIGNARCLFYWESLTVMKAYVFDEDLDYVLFTYDSDLGTILETQHGTYAIV